MADKQQTDLGE